MFSWVPLLRRIHKKNETDFTVSLTIGESKRFYEGSLVKSNDLQFVAKFAIAGPDGEVPQPTVNDEELTEEVKEDFTEARDVDALRRRVGTVQQGASVSLNWEGSSDLGLSIVDSNGEELSFFNPEGMGGGKFDMEGYDPRSGSRQIRWDSSPPSGTYSIVVRHFEAEGEGGEVQFEVNVNNRGDEQQFSGSIQPDGSTVEVGSFEV